MKDVNQVVFIGRLTADAKLGSYKEQSKLDFSVAINNTKKNGNEYVDEPTFINLSLWGKTADALATRLTKGTQVAVEGYLKQSRWEKDGQKMSALNVIVDHIQIIFGGKKSESAPAQPSSSDSSGFSEDLLF